ncbi:hypothetical protein BH20CHL7_BH20CHL7_04460 [soil metagenome]
MDRIPLLGATLQRLDLGSLASASGTLDPAMARAVVHRLNAARPAEARQAVPGELLALSLLHEVAHLAITAAARRRPDVAMAPTLAAVREAVGDRRAEQLLGRFAMSFPGVHDAAPRRLEDLALVRLAEENPAATPLNELVDRSGLPPADLAAAISAVERHFGGMTMDGDPGEDPAGEDPAGGRSLLDLLREPARHAPNSLIGQLRYVRDHWSWLLGDELSALLDRVDITIGILAEEEAGLHRRFGGFGGFGGPGEVRPPSFGGAAE